MHTDPPAFPPSSSVLTRLHRYDREEEFFIHASFVILQRPAMQGLRCEGKGREGSFETAATRDGREERKGRLGCNRS
jgi:hypothetical protein